MMPLLRWTPLACRDVSSPLPTFFSWWPCEKKNDNYITLLISIVIINDSTPQYNKKRLLDRIFFPRTKTLDVYRTAVAFRLLPV